MSSSTGRGRPRRSGRGHKLGGAHEVVRRQSHLHPQAVAGHAAVAQLLPAPTVLSQPSTSSARLRTRWLAAHPARRLVRRSRAECRCFMATWGVMGSKREEGLPGFLPGGVLGEEPACQGVGSQDQPVRGRALPACAGGPLPTGPRRWPGCCRPGRDCCQTGRCLPGGRTSTAGRRGRQRGSYPPWPPPARRAAGSRPGQPQWSVPNCGRAPTGALRLPASTACWGMRHTGSRLGSSRRLRSNLERVNRTGGGTQCEGDWLPEQDSNLRPAG